MNTPQHPSQLPITTRLLLLAGFALVLGLALPAWSAPSDLPRILAELQKPDSQHVFVAAHRGMAGLSTGAWNKYPENSPAAIARTIELGVDIVEVDVQKTKDGRLILMHDTSVDRTTDGRGYITNLTFAEIRKLHLKMGDGGTNALTDQRVPTLEEGLLAAKGKCLVNLDKAHNLIPECHAVLKRTGTTGQAIFKSSYDADRCKKDLALLDPPAIFMPVIIHKKDWKTKEQQGWELMEPYVQKTRPWAFELVFVADEDPIVAPETIARIKKTGAHVWINTLWDKLAAGHTDARSLVNPEEGWGWVIARGANILQTDETERLLEYLRARQLHW